MSAPAISGGPSMTHALRRRDEAQRRNRAALASLAARQMPLPGETTIGGSDAPQRLVALPVPVQPATTFADPGLSPREIEVLCTWLLVDSKVEVGENLFISMGTVNTHITRIRAKYSDVGRQAPTKAALVARAVQDGLISLDEL